MNWLRSVLAHFHRQPRLVDSKALREARIETTRATSRADQIVRDAFAAADRAVYHGPERRRVAR